MDPAHAFKRRWLAMGLGLTASLSAGALLLMGCSSQGAEQGCAATPACGGKILGNWTATGSCQYLAVSAYKGQTLVPQQTTPQTPSLGKGQPSSVTSGNWCSDLVYLPPDAVSATGHVTNVNLWFPPGKLVASQLSLKADQTYAITFEFDSPAATHFTPGCLQAYGANPSCTDLAAAMQQIIDPFYHDLACVPATDQGCDCSYNYKLLLADSGSWHTIDGVLYEYSQTGQQPFPVDYCVVDTGSGPSLTLTGHNGWNLNNIAGLRTLQMGPQAANP